MNNIQFLRLGTILTRVVIGGEALAFLIGMHFLSERSNPWISFKNDFLIALDLVTALGLILTVTMNRNVLSSSTFYLLALVSILSHGYRGWEYFANVQNKFCINTPLFMINGLKLFGLLIVIALNVAGKLTPTIWK